MGSSESKMAACAAVKPELIKNDRVSQLFDPRSPSAGIDRTPIQIAEPVSKTSAAVKSECPEAFTDPRSPSVGITRTPVREVMRATMGSLARRLGVFFHNEAEGKVPPKCFSDAVEEEEEELKDEELASTEPLLTPQVPRNFGSLVEHANLLATPVQPPLHTVGGSSPYVLLDEPQLEVEVEAEMSLEEAEEARESPLHKRLSMSLITCHEGAVSSQILAEVHHDSTSSPVPTVEAEPIRNGVDHLYALPIITVEPESEPEAIPTTDESNAPASPTQPEETVQPAMEKPVEESPELPAPAAAPAEPPSAPTPEQTKIPFPCLTIDSKSPSQVVFKPQWLGKGFGASGLRARAGQRHGRKGGSSPLAVSVAVKNGTNENKGRSGKLKQKGTEGRSPLQILKETNSPRERPQMKLKVSTPDRQRLGQLDRRVLTVALDKENR